ncbi:glycosyltransferase family 4 protein [Rhodococcus sp. H36-A4]|uniref:glycosyltransferase family 4 protein n=1 Tax=Rhodococcus sp. H36-A4 TaxID=3004353 RepID=UPI0022AF79D8|nr:glycosyltransferase family 4 protein [Rhodococcus sp. H36-A4]MCZ4078933.1 glycosyltransferase family 4 protein [Rhodococcus sp. H36-A4]
MTKVLFVTHTAAPSGAELATLRLAISLHDIDVGAVFTEDGPMVARMRAQGIDTRVLRNTFDSRSITIANRTPLRLVAGFVGLAKVGWGVGAAARDFGATVLVAESTKALVVAAVAARRAHIPLVWHVHDRISVAYFGRMLSVLIRVFGWVVSRGYIANSRSTMSLLFTWRRKSLVAYPGVLLDDLDDRESQRNPTETIIAVVGRLTPWKGQDLFLRALADVKVRPRHVYLVGGTFFGEEAFRDELRRLTTKLDLPVTFTGHVDHPGEFMGRADILVHCSVVAEPFGQVVVEGMHAGCAVIATQPGGTTEIVDSGVNGLLVDGGDQQQLTDALNALIGDRELRQRLTVAGQLRAEQFDVCVSARAVGLFLEDIASPVAS